MNKLLIANRGEIALRVIRACRELGLRTVAVYSTADERAPHVRGADEAVWIGEPPARRSYLNAEALLDAARRTGADALHPGYGFLAENAGFARACIEAGLTWVGPAPEVMERMADKAAAREAARAAGVPVVPGTAGTVAPEEAESAAGELGYPVMIKAAGGGGGRGIRVAPDAEALRAGLRDATDEAEAAFGDGRLYLEKLIERPRHVEVQVLGEAHGRVVHLYERECSLQRRRQKLVEEAPAPMLGERERAEMGEAAARLAESVSYTGAGTVEFVVAADGAFHFIEMNTRIQVEHPVTEAVTGVDLVKEQLRLAAGEPLSMSQGEVAVRGAAIELRVNAEDPVDFKPSAGTITRLELPGGPGVRVDHALAVGYEVPPFYDSLLAKLIVWGADRDEAIARARRALAELRIDGIPTTIPFHMRLLEDAGFAAGEYHTEYLAERGLA
jgi:acetyl-CoA carboxylase, biotin carboxylase subunit